MPDSTAVIKSAVVRASQRSAMQRDVVATLEDGSEEIVWTFYPDELYFDSFDLEDMVGISLAEASRQCVRKDQAYLQS